jgi:hypothetical protein
MSTMETKNFGTPDEVRTLPKTNIEVINLGDASVVERGRSAERTA